MPLPLRARVFMAAVIGVGALVLSAAFHALLRDPEAPRGLVLAGLAVVTGSFMIKLPRIETRFSLSDTLVFTSVLLLGPSYAAVVASVDAVAASLRFNKGDRLYISRTLFNGAAAAVSAWVPAQAFLAAGGQLMTSAAAVPLSAIVLPLVLLVTGYSVLNTGTIATVIALTARKPVTRVWRDNFAWLWIAHAWSGLVAGAIAIYIPHVNATSLLVILAVAAVGYATVRLYVVKLEESTDRLHKLNELYLATIRALALAIDAKDQVTHGHIRRAQVYAVGLAEALGVTDEATLKGIEAGALLHDTGKIAVPEHILNKPGKLNAHEYERMKEHVTIGADILSGIDFPYPVLPLVRHHHENWDGTGYPDGLKGEDIPLGARILSVVDCFDALTSDRPYRRALTVDAALDILRERTGTMYDARIVDTFIQVQPRLTAALQAEAALEGERVDDRVEAVSSSGFGDDRPDPAAVLADLPRLGALGLSPEELALVLLHRLQPALPFTTAAVYVPDASTDRLEAIHVAGRDAEVFRRSCIPLTEGLSGWVAAHGQIVTNGNPVLDLHGPVANDQIALASALVVPFTAASGAQGAMAFYADAPEAYTLDDARLGAAAAGHLSRALLAAGRRPPSSRRTTAA
jgi:putative nucleotidyltransferase with HDIG domain